MSVLYVIVPAVLVVVAAAVAAYVWAAKRGQFDDLTTPALRMLHDDPPRRDVDAGGAGVTPRRRSRPRQSPPAAREKGSGSDARP
jgi:cbb3-type cytochrome oxidase maturation protein